jgi:hypothetical protein
LGTRTPDPEADGAPRNWTNSQADTRPTLFALRFRACGKREYLTLGTPEDGWTVAMAQRELAVVLRDVDLGIWRPPRPDPAPTKHA